MEIINIGLKEKTACIIVDWSVHLSIILGTHIAVYTVWEAIDVDKKQSEP